MSLEEIWERRSEKYFATLPLHCLLSEKRCNGNETEATLPVSDLPCPTTMSKVTICIFISRSDTSHGSTNASLYSDQRPPPSPPEAQQLCIHLKGRSVSGFLQVALI